MAFSIRHYGLNTPDIFEVYCAGDIIQTMVTKEPGKVRDWIIQTEYIHRDGLNRLLVGLDVKWRSLYEHSPAEILLLCVDRRCLIFQLLQCGFIPHELIRFLANTAYTFVGVGIRDNLNKLTRNHPVEVTKVVDLRDLAWFRSNVISQRFARLMDLARIYLDLEMLIPPIELLMSGWHRPLLSNEQVMYACIDAFISFKIGLVLDASY